MSPHANLSLNESFFNLSFAPKQQTPPWIISIPESQRITWIVCYAAILILSVVGNTSIIFVVARNLSMRSTINYLIANMAATDLAASVVVAGWYFSILHNLSQEFEVSGIFGSVLCKLCYYIKDVSITVSIQCMVAIAFDRLFAVVFPLRAKPRLLDSRILLPFIWLLSLGFFALELTDYKLLTIRGVDICINTRSLGLLKVFYMTLVGMFYLVPFVIVAVLYSKIALKMKLQSFPGKQTSSTGETRRKRNRKVAKMAFAIVSMFFICWAPYHILIIMTLFAPKLVSNGISKVHLGFVFEMCTFISYISFIVNPYICFIFSSNFREGFRSTFPFSVFYTTRIVPAERIAA